MSEIAIPVIVTGIICTMFFFWRMTRWLGPRLWLLIAALPALALCFWLPISVLLDGLRPWGAIVTWGGNIWMVTALAFTAIAMILEVIRALVWLYFKRGEGEGRDALPAGRSVPATLVLLLLFITCSAFEAQSIRATHLAIQTDKLPDGVNNYRIAFVSDIHLNELSGEKFLTRITRLIEEQTPDLLLFGGDILSDPDMRPRQKEAALLAKAMPPSSSLGVLGNHEAMNDHIGNAIPFLKRAWIHVMRGEAIAVGNVYVVGVDDPKVAEIQGSAAHDPMIILSRIPRDRFVILLKHRPDIQRESIGLFDLQLSAHTHGGQIWPAKYALELFFDAPQARLAKIEGPDGASWYYCTTGAGFNALPLRFLTPPEVVILDLVR